MEYLHHGDPLVPRQQRFGGYTRSLIAALGVPVHNVWGLRPALVTGTREIAPLKTFRDLDALGLLAAVPTLNFHPHLPHYELTGGGETPIHVLAQQPVDLARPHPVRPGRRQGVQFVALGAAAGRPGRRHSGDGLNPFHHPFRRHRQPGELLAEPGEHALPIDLGAIEPAFKREARERSGRTSRPDRCRCAR